MTTSFKDEKVFKRFLRHLSNTQSSSLNQHNQEFSMGEPLPVNCWDDSTVFVSPDTEHLGTPWPGGVGLWEQ